jgi:hypothetical protein
MRSITLLRTSPKNIDRYKRSDFVRMRDIRANWIPEAEEVAICMDDRTLVCPKSSPFGLCIDKVTSLMDSPISLPAIICD